MRHMIRLWRRLRIWFSGKPQEPKLFRANKRFKTQYPNYKVGFGTYGLPKVHDWNQGTTLIIGSYCSIARNVQIYLGGNHRTDWVSTYPFPEYLPQARHIGGSGQTRGDVVIGSDVWLCNDCVILSGVNVGHGAVIGTGAIISRDVEPYAIMAGNPAKLVRYRFDEITRKALLKTAWWDWPEEEVIKAVELLNSNDLPGFITYAQTRNLKN